MWEKGERQKLEGSVKTSKGQKSLQPENIGMHFYKARPKYYFTTLPVTVVTTKG